MDHERSALAHLLWIAGGAALAFLSAYVFADLLALPRGWFLVPHVAFAGAFLAAYVRWSGTQLGALWRKHVALGVLGAVLIGSLLVFNVLSQPASPRVHGASLVADLLWLGLVYGAVDGLLLSVFPVIASWRASARLAWTRHGAGRLSAAALAIAASALMTTCYHAGYAEFRGPALGQAVLGNTIMTVGQLVTASPVAATGSHIAMHVAAVLHGPASTVQLPPHERPR